MKQLLPCTACGINTVQTVIAGGKAVCWCGCENDVKKDRDAMSVEELREHLEQKERQK